MELWQRETNTELMKSMIIFSEIILIFFLSLSFLFFCEQLLQPLSYTNIGSVGVSLLAQIFWANIGLKNKLTQKLLISLYFSCFLVTNTYTYAPQLSAQVSHGSTLVFGGSCGDSHTTRVIPRLFLA